MVQTTPAAFGLPLPSTPVASHTTEHHPSSDTPSSNDPVHRPIPLINRYDALACVAAAGSPPSPHSLSNNYDTATDRPFVVQTDSFTDMPSSHAPIDDQLHTQPTPPNIPNPVAHSTDYDNDSSSMRSSFLLPPIPSTQGSAIISNCLSTVWNVKSPRPFQIQAINCVITKKTRLMFLIRKTGEGKSLVIYGVSTILRGITISMVPLIGLGSDQAHKSKNLEHRVESYHLDEYKEESFKTLRHRLLSLRLSERRSIILYVSPHVLSPDSPWQPTIVKLAKLNLISAYFIDEAHAALTQNSFRPEFLTAIDTISKIASTDTPIIATSATLRQDDQLAFSRLLKREPDTIMWGPMDRRSIRLDVSIAGQLTTALEKFFVASILRNRNGKIIIYTNSKLAAETSLKESIESLLKKNNIEGCVMPFTGDNGIMMKNYVMTSFCPDDITCIQDMENIFCVIGTAAMECGVSSKEVTTGISVGMPRSLYDLYQYMGRVDRKHDALPGQVSYSVLLNVPSFLFMYVRALSEPDITMRERQERDLMEVLRFLVLPTQCYHLSMELYLQDPENVANNNHCVEPCNVCCPFCDDSYLGFADKINKTNLTMILQTDLYRNGSLPLQDLVGILSNDKCKLKKKIYGSGFSKKPQGKIHGLVLMMIASNIIELSVDDPLKLGTERLNTSNIISRLGIVSSKKCDNFSDNGSSDDSDDEYNVFTTSQESSWTSFNVK